MSGPGALRGPAETGAGGVRRLLVPILLNRGFGYEDYLRFAPLWRSTIGFDRLFDLVDAAQQAGTEDNTIPLQR